MVNNNFETFLMDIDSIATENDLLMIVDRVRKLDSALFSQCMLAFREKVIVLMMEQGILPPLNLIQLFPMIRHCAYHFERDLQIDNHVILLKKHLLNVEKNSYEYFLIVDLIFIMNMLNGELDKGFFDYLSSIVKSNIFEAYKYPEAYQQFTNTLRNCNILDIEIVGYLSTLLEPDIYFEDDLEVQSSILIWIMSVIYNEPNYSASTAFFELEKSLNAIMLTALKLERLEQAMAIYNVAHHLLGNLFQTQEKMAIFNAQFTKPIALEYKKYAHSLSRLTTIKKKKKKIAIIRDRLVNNSPHMIEYRLVSMLMREAFFTDNYELYLYSAGYIEKDLDDIKIMSAYEKLGVIVKAIPNEWYAKGYYYNHLDKAIMIRNDMIQENIDIMIGTVGHDSIDFLFATRTAPHQIYWSHGNFEYDVPNIDRRITHCSVPVEGFAFSHFSVLRDYSQYQAQQVISEAETIRNQYGKDTVILGSIGRLVKVDSLEYLESVAKLLHKNSNAIYLACGSGSMESIKRKVEALGIEDRFVFVGFVEAKIYVNVLDIYLDTFPHHGGESVREAQMAGCCVASLHVESEKGPPDPISIDNDSILKQVNYQLEMLDAELLDNEGFIHQVISFASLNTDAYIGIVDFFINHPDDRQVVKNFFKTYMPEAISYKEFLEVIGFE